MNCVLNEVDLMLDQQWNELDDWARINLDSFNCTHIHYDGDNVLYALRAYQKD